MPDFDSIMIQVKSHRRFEKCYNNIPDMPDMKNQVNFSYKTSVPGNTRKDIKIKVNF